MRVTGLDLKMEQYVEGERFVAAVLAARDRRRPCRVWRGPECAARPRRDPRTRSAGSTAARGAPARGARQLSDEIVILATPIFGAPLSAEHAARLEAVPGVRVIQMSRDGLVHDDAEARASARRGSCCGAASPASCSTTSSSGRPQLEWIHSFSAGVDRVATPLSASAA